MTLKLRSKLILVFFLSFFLPISIIGAFSYRLMLKRIKGNALRAVHTENLKLKDSFFKELASIERDFHLYLEMIEDDSLLIERLKYFGSTIGDAMARIVVYDERNKETITLKRGISGRGYKVYKVSEDVENLIFRNEIILPDQGGYTLRLHHLIPQSKSIFLFVKLPYLFSQSLFQFDTTGGREVKLLNKDGVILYDSDITKINTVHEFETGRKIRNNKVVSTDKLENLDLYIETSASLLPVLIPIKRVATISIIFLLIIYLITSATVYVFIKRFTENLKELVTQAAKIKDGQTISSDVLERGDEIGELSRHLKDISEKLIRDAQLMTFYKLTAFITHDLKNYVAQLSLLMRNLEKHYENPAFKEDAIFTMRSTIGKMEELIKKLKAVRREEEAREEVELSSLIKNILEKMGIAEGVKVVLDIKERIFVMRREFEKLLTNLIMNSIEAMPGGGLLKISAVVEENELIINVEDTGIGIPEEILNRVTEPFITTKSNGLGLGLYEVSEIVKRLEGKMKIESKTGAGTKVTIRVKKWREKS